MAHILHMGPVNQPRRSTELQEKAFKNGSRSQINEDLYLQKITLDVPEHFIIWLEKSMSTNTGYRGKALLSEPGDSIT